MSSSKWKVVKLGDLLNFRRGHDLPKTKMNDGKIPVVGSNGVIGFHDEFTTKAPCLTIGRSGNIGNPCYISKDCWAHNTTLYVDDFKNNNPKYLYYLLKTLNLGYYGGGSAVPTLNRNHIHPIEVNATLDSDEQKIIADTLSCLDDKIELNNCINNNLEETAKAIFKNWFVDFEPFQDDEFDDSELGRIPKGWRAGTIAELISDTIGGDWGKETEDGNYTEEVICIRGADIPEIASGKKGKPPLRYILKKNLDKKALSEGQIIIEISGGSPTQSTGRAAYITRELVTTAKSPLICTNFCRALSFKKEHHSTFIYSTLKYLYDKDVFFLYENGTTGIKNLDTNNLFSKHLIVLPDDETMVRFKEIFDTIIKYIYQNGDEIDKLATIRDSLLSKLMNGEIRIPLEEVK